MATGATDPHLYRQIVEVLVVEFERGKVPTPLDHVSARVFACAWGLYAQVHRHAKAALVLTDAGMAQEAHVMVRVALEHTVMLHWIVERGEAGVTAMLASQSESVNRSLRTMRKAELVVPPEVEKEIERLSPDFSDSEVVGQFRQVCEQLDVLDLYVLYGGESAFVHPSAPTVNAYCDDSGQLVTAPQRDIHRGNFALLAPFLIWAGRDLEQLIPGQPRTDGLEKLAASIGAHAALPPYRAAQPAPTGRRRRR
jgi:Family of unknown function (DUF5677)